MLKRVVKNLQLNYRKYYLIGKVDLSYLVDGPIYSRGYIYGYADNSSRIYFALHQLIVDTVSWRILVEHLRELYNGKE